MDFWCGLHSIIWLLFIISLLLGEKNAKYPLYVTIFIVWIVGACRLNIGSDYTTYEELYDSWNIYSGGVLDFVGSTEPTFWIIVGLLNELNFKSQMLFLIYETIVIVFMYKGFSYYIKEKIIIFFAFVIYVMYPTNGGYWWGFCFIRQAAATSMIFWGTKYLLEKRRLKFFLAMFSGILFHYSGIFSILLVALKKRISIYKVYLLLILGFIFNGTGINAWVGMKFLSALISFTGRYEAALLMADAGSLSFSIMAFVLSVIYIIANKMKKTESLTIVHNGAALYILLRVYMSFGIEGSVLSTITHRFETFFLPFYIIFIALAVRDFVYSQKNKILANMFVICFVLMFSFMGLYRISQEKMAIDTRGTKSSANVQYEFNFDMYR